MTKELDDVAHLTEIAKVRRKDLGVTQEELSLVTGISIRSISDFENGNGGISLDRLLLITRTLGLDLKLV